LVHLYQTSSLLPGHIPIVTSARQTNYILDFKLESPPIFSPDKVKARARWILSNAFGRRTMIKWTSHLYWSVNFVQAYTWI
jgi:hypothetical protein